MAEKEKWDLSREEIDRRLRERNQKKKAKVPTRICNLPKQVATLPWSAKRKWLLRKAEAIFEKFRNYLQDSSTATATETVMPTMGLLPLLSGKLNPFQSVSIC